MEQAGGSKNKERSNQFHDTWDTLLTLPRITLLNYSTGHEICYNYWTRGFNTDSLEHATGPILNQFSAVRIYTASITEINF